MPSVDLLFEEVPLEHSPIDLVFGAIDTGPPPATRTLYVDGKMPAMRGSGTLRRVKRLHVSGRMPAMRGAGVAIYDPRVSRPTVGEVRTRFQQGLPAPAAVETSWQNGLAMADVRATRWQDGIAVAADTSTWWQDSQRQHREQSTRWQDANPVHASTQTRFQRGVPIHKDMSTRYQRALQLEAATTAIRFQQGLKRRSFTETRYQRGIALSHLLETIAGYGTPLMREWATRYQNAIKPPAGQRVRPGPPTPDPCYVPPPGDAVHLLFKEEYSTSTDLLFVCETHGGGPGPEPGETIVVPVRKVYVVVNSASLKRVSDNTPIIVFDAVIGTDVDSWTWTLTASIPRVMQPLVEPIDDEPVEVELMVNGVPYRFIVEDIQRDTRFAESTVRIGGRGVSALLDAPYAPVLNFGNIAPLTAEQLVGEVMSFSGVPIPDWTVTFGLTDWNVPAGLWTHQGTHISALNDIVQAVGGYLQSHPSSKTLLALPRYPEAPWNWSAVTPDYDLPSAVTVQEGISWATKARYNRVYVSGIKAGVLGEVTREGTAGDLVAQMATHALITEAAAARQRGQAILSNTGRIAVVTLNLPVLSSTGIIRPGKWVRYTENSVVWKGITRSVSVNVGLPEIMQTITVETHVD